MLIICLLSHQQLYQKEKQLMQLENKCESNKEEIQVMTDLFQNFKRELKNTGVGQTSISFIYYVCVTLRRCLF